MVHVKYNTDPHRTILDPLGKYRSKYNVVGPYGRAKLVSNKIHKGDTSGFIYIPVNPKSNRKKR